MRADAVGFASFGGTSIHEACIVMALFPRIREAHVSPEMVYDDCAMTQLAPASIWTDCNCRAIMKSRCTAVGVTAAATCDIMQAVFTVVQASHAHAC